MKKVIYGILLVLTILFSMAAGSPWLLLVSMIFLPLLCYEIQWKHPVITTKAMVMKKHAVLLGYRHYSRITFQLPNGKTCKVEVSGYQHDRLAIGDEVTLTYKGVEARKIVVHRDGKSTEIR